MAYVLGKKSLFNLSGVHPDLVRVVRRAIGTTEQDFMVFEGIRTTARQRELVRRGASRTMNSKHLAQRDGYSHAVDLVPWIAGLPRWKWPAIYPIAAAMREAARAEGVNLIWGGAWDCFLSDTRSSLKDEVAAYCARHAGPDFIDGPHYQLAG